MNKPLPPAEASKGHNRPPVLTPDELARDFGYLDASLEEISNLVGECPPVAEDDEDIDKLRSVVRRCMGAHKRLEAIRVEAKEPYLGAGRIVDAHFNGLKEKVGSWQAKLEAVAKRLLDKRDTEERERRQEEARRIAEEARVAAEKARQAERDRVRKEQERQEQEQRQLAEAFAGEAPTAPDEPEIDLEAARRAEHTANTESLNKTNEALKAKEAAEAKPADLVRVRSSEGVSTLQQVFKFEIEDHTKIKPDELWEFIPAQEVEKAIRRCVALHKDQRKLSGVRIFQDTKVMMT